MDTFLQYDDGVIIRLYLSSINKELYKAKGSITVSYGEIEESISTGWEADLIDSWEDDLFFHIKSPYKPLEFLIDFYTPQIEEFIKEMFV